MRMRVCCCYREMMSLMFCCCCCCCCCRKEVATKELRRLKIGGYRSSRLRAVLSAVMVWLTNGERMRLCSETTTEASFEVMKTAKEEEEEEEEAEEEVHRMTDEVVEEEGQA